MEEYMEEFLLIWKNIGPEHLNIMITCPCDEDPHTPHLHIVKLGLV